MGTNSWRLRATARIPMAWLIVMAGSAGLGVSAAHGSGSIRYVDAAAPTGGDGRSWEGALAFLTDALADAAADPGVVEIRIAQGRYVPDQSHAVPRGTGARDATFTMRSGLSLVGGFAGPGSGDPDTWDPALYESVLDGDLAGDDDPETGLGRDENAWRVLFVPTGGPGTRLAGLTVRGGYGDTPDWNGERGGGVRVSTGSILIEDCRIEENYASISGGGIHLGFGVHRVERTVFRNNGFPVPDQSGTTSWTAHGGGLAKYAGVLEIVDCLFVHNGAEVGGAISVDNTTTSLLIDGSTFEGNIGGVGGAVRIGMAVEALITHSRFIGNAGSPGPGAVFMFTSGQGTIESSEFIANAGGMFSAVMMGSTNSNIMPLVQSSTFIMNTSSAFGGALSGENLNVVNSLFSRNQSPEASSLFVSRRVRILHCTFHDGRSPVLYNQYAVPGNLIANSILYSTESGPIITMNPSALMHLTVRDSIVRDGWSGPGYNIIDADPLFRNPGMDDLRLLADSPAIDAGDNMWVPRDLHFDLDGLPRIQNGIVDMGCFEGPYDPVAQATSIPYIPAGGEVVLSLEGGQPSVWTKRVVRVQNLTNEGAGPTILTELPQESVAPGAAMLSAPLRIETAMPKGSLLVRMSMPFHGADLGGAVPAAADLMGVHPLSERWVRAPLVDGALGARTVRLDGGMPQIPFTLGSYGLGWDPVNERGFVAAMLDGPGIFAPAIPTCPADIAGFTDGMVSWNDVIAIVSRFGTGWGPADVNADGAVDLDDLVEALSNWGPCP